MRIYPPHTRRSTDSPTRIKLSGKRRGLTINIPIAAAIKKKSAMRIKTRFITASTHLFNSSETLGDFPSSAFKEFRCAHLVISGKESLSSRGFLLNIPFYSTPTGGCQA